MIKNVQLPETVELTAKELHSGYLGERVAISPDGGTSGIIGTLQSFKMTALPPVANSSGSITVKVRIGESKYVLQPEQAIRVLNLYARHPLP